MEGEVIGINTAILSPSGGSIGIGFAIPSALAAPIVDQLRQYGETRRGWLGVRIQSVDDNIAETLGLGTPHGALVAGIDEKGPAKVAGLEPGDVIATGSPAGVAHFMKPQRFLKPGDVVRCEIEKVGFIENLVVAEVL